MTNLGYNFLELEPGRYLVLTPNRKQHLVNLPLRLCDCIAYWNGDGKECLHIKLILKVLEKEARRKQNQIQVTVHGQTVGGE